MNVIHFVDYRNNLHTAIAVKPKSADPKDSYLLIVLHTTGTTGSPFVVHLLNLEDGGYSNGRYCETLADALIVFNQAN